MYYSFKFIIVYLCNCSACWYKCVKNTTMKKNFPCTDFCVFALACENADSDPILENNDFPHEDV